MTYRNGNYSAFYVDEPFDEGNLGASATRDFVTYNLLRAWKASDEEFPFIDSHNKNYNVRDGSDWETTLKPRLHERLNNSKNIIFILSSITKNSRALREEIDHGMGTCGLPVIVIYPEYENTSDLFTQDQDGKHFKQEIVELWAKVPRFKDLIDTVPTVHIPFKKDILRKALNDDGYTVQNKKANGKYII